MQRPLQHTHTHARTHARTPHTNAPDSYTRGRKLEAQGRGFKAWWWGGRGPLKVYAIPHAWGTHARARAHTYTHTKHAQTQTTATAAHPQLQSHPPAPQRHPPVSLVTCYVTRWQRRSYSAQAHKLEKTDQNSINPEPPNLNLQRAKAALDD